MISFCLLVKHLIKSCSSNFGGAANYVDWIVLKTSAVITNKIVHLNAAAIKEYNFLFVHHQVAMTANKYCRFIFICCSSIFARTQTKRAITHLIQYLSIYYVIDYYYCVFLCAWIKCKYNVIDTWAEQTNTHTYKQMKEMQRHAIHTFVLPPDFLLSK